MPENGDDYVVTHKTYDDYFTDFDIKAETITEADLTGSGSATDPYLVHSTRGFLWLSNYSLSRIILQYKYAELRCDVVLNEETFDENGNPLGGDGCVYSWQPIRYCFQASIEGNNLIVYGCYINDITAEVATLFCDRMHSIKNLSVKDCFLLSKKSASGVINAEQNPYETNLINVHNLGGYIKSKSLLGGVAVGNFTKVENCTNYADITQIETENTSSGNLCGVAPGTYMYHCKNFGDIEFFQGGYIGGIHYQANRETANCQNFGKIVGSGKCTGLGGIAGYVGQTKIENCQNYGEIVSSYSGYKGGIAGYFIDILTMKNCTNYANLEGVAGLGGGGYNGEEYIFENCSNYGNVSGSAAFVCQMQASAKFLNCKNYGVIDARSTQRGGLCAYSYDNTQFINCEIYGSFLNCDDSYFSLDGWNNGNHHLSTSNCIFDCEVSNSSKNYLNLFGAYWPSKSCSYTISNCMIKIKASGSIKAVRMMNSYDSAVSLSNIELSVNFDGEGKTEFCNGAYGKSNFKNILIQTKSTSSKAGKFILVGKENVDADGIIKIHRYGNTEIRQYHGSDFSGFYSDWKGGKIGLAKLSNIGLFSKKLNVDILKNRGFVETALQ